MSTPSTTPRIDRTTFLTAVKASGVLTGPNLAQIDDAPEAADTAVDVARWLMAEGLLTRLQAERLLTGKHEGLVLGQYVILELLGQSLSGRVYKARHRTMQRLAAIKVVAPGLARTEADRAAVQAEARAAAQLTHPNVVTVWDVNRYGASVYLVREFVDGDTAAAMVRANGPLSVLAACEIVRQAADGAQHAHEKGLPHGAITPENLRVSKAPAHPVVKVTNFGLCRLAGTDRDAGADEYRAPELADGTGTAAGDLYSLGAVLHFLLTGHPPRGVLLHRPDVPPELFALIVDLTAADPARRPQAADVVARLGGIIRRVHGAGPGSGSWTPPAGIVVPVPPPVTHDTSPWSDLAPPTAENAAQPTPVSIRPPTRRPAAATGESPVHSLLLFGVIAAIVAGTLVAGALLIRGLAG